MSWYIDPNYNSGYPYNTDMPTSFITSFTHGVDGIYYNIYSWRCADNINGGYPFTWVQQATLRGWWYDGRPLGSYDGAADQVIFTIGGSQTNYPNGFTTANTGGLLGQFDSNNMDLGGYGGGSVRVSLLNGMRGRMFAVDGAELETIVNFLNTGLSAIEQTKISLLYGANVYDGILVCKSYPFQMSYEQSTPAYMFGDISLPIQLNPATVVVSALNFGSVTLDIQQAWEIENVDFSIYLPYAGIFPIDIRGPHTISVKCYVDKYSGVGEYYVFADNQLIGTYKCQMGADVPMNYNQGVMSSNINSLILSTVSSGLPLVGAAAGGAVGAAVGGFIGGTMSQGVSHSQVSAPQVGSATSSYTYPYVRILAKIPKMFNDGYGYNETQGANRSTTFAQLGTCSGFVRCREYKCDVIVATDDEKREIEQLLNAGVFI